MVEWIAVLLLMQRFRIHVPAQTPVTLVKDFRVSSQPLYQMPKRYLVLWGRSISDRFSNRRTSYLLTWAYWVC